MHPGEAEKNVTVAGKVSVKVTLEAELGPRLVMVSVYVRFFPVRAGFGEAVTETARSALALQHT
jgi:hypothetical protein